MDATEITNKLLKRVDYSDLERLKEVEFETEEIIYHMDFSLVGSNSVECSLTVLRYNESDDDYLAVENKELCEQVEGQFIDELERIISDYSHENNGGLDPAFRSWEEVNRMCY